MTDAEKIQHIKEEIAWYYSESNLGSTTDAITIIENIDDILND